MPRPPIDNGVVVLTGASSGIGAAMARQLAPRVQTLVIVARRQERLEALAASLRAAHSALTVLVRPCDLTDTIAAGALIASVEAECGRIDVLINNAGMGDVGLLEAADWAKLRTMIDINVVALTFLIHAVLPGMLARGRGGILNVSSGFGLTWLPLFSSYVGTKHYVSALTESLRAELWGTGVCISQLCPGPVATEFEQIAGNPLGQSVPSAVELSADRCAELALRGFSQGRALIVPGAAAWVIVTAGRLTPTWLLRWVYGPIGRSLRARVQGQGEQ